MITLTFFYHVLYITEKLWSIYVLEFVPYAIKWGLGREGKKVFRNFKIRKWVDSI